MVKIQTTERIEFLRIWHSIMRHMNRKYSLLEVERVRKIFAKLSKLKD